VDETSMSETQPSEHGEPSVESVLEGGTARITVEGELTAAARRPLVRSVTALLLEHEPLQRIELHLAGVSFMNSAGMAVLVQLQRMAQPRRVEVALVAPPVAVVRPLQLSGLWARFPILDVPEGPHPEA
jgi:stage II sporulation protein AA (anti-sigma F factor antagonist)